MFSIQHFIWIAISILCIVLGLVYLNRRRPPLMSVIKACSLVCIASELIKVLSCLELVPYSDGSVLVPYLEMQHLPLHLCSIQLLTIFYCRFAPGSIAESVKKQSVLQFMYITCALAAPFAIALPSIFNTTITASQAFTHPIAYQVFLYHAMLIVLGIYIPMSGEVKFSWASYRKTMVMMCVLSFVCIYLNSMFASPTYVNGELVSVDYITNFFFIFRTPIGVALNSKLAWFVYILILAALLFGLSLLMYIPLRRSKVWERKSKVGELDN